MKKYLHALAMCRSMFCAIPCFWRVWDEEARDKMLLFLPVVGLETGAIWALLAWLCRYLALPALVQGAVLGAYPFVCLLYTSPRPRDRTRSRMPSSA